MPSLLESPIDLSRLSRQDKEALVGVYAEKARRHFLDFCHYTDRNYQSPAHIQHLISKLEAVERGEIKRLMIFMPPRHGKQCADSTPVITTKGWTTHGNLKVGDYVFHPSGKPVRILHVSEKTVADIEIEFFNGAKIRCHRNHEWTVFDRGCGRWKTYETNYFIKQNKFGNKKKIVSGNRARYQLPLCEALEFGEKELIIPPYVLGAWLGDGTSTAPAITGDAKDFQIIDAIKKHYAVSSVNIHKTTGCLTTRFGSGSTRASIFGDALRSLKVFANKHIPDIYKFSSIGQRLELLAGIIDTDGYVDKHSRVKIVTASKTLADDIKEVIVSLGWRVYAQKQKPTLSTSGIQGKKPVYYICFNPDKGIPTQLPRKKIKRFPIKRMIGIKNIKEVAGEPGHCITVDSPDGLYLVGRELVPTHNSETVSRKFPAWYLGRNPDHNVILSSYAYSLAKGFSKDNRDMIEGRIYQTVFPISTKDDSRAVNDWDIAGYRGGMLAAGVGGPITGFGSNIFIIDDPFKNQQEAESPLIRENVWQWYRSVVLTRLEPAAGLILIMTRWHRDDLAGRILDEDKDWDIVNFPALAETDDVLGRKEGSALWPGRFSEPALMVTKNKVGSRVWNALYQQHPMDAESQKFRREWFQWYDSLPVAIKRKGSGIDTATSLKSSNDNTALVDVCRGDDNFLYVDDCFCEKITVSGFAKHLIDKQRLNGYDKVHLEKNNAGEAFKQRIDEISREERVAVPVECVQTTTDKMVRAMEFQPFVENGTLRFKRSNKKVAELVEHLINFDGNGGDVDDDVDALGFAVKAALGEGDIFIGTSDRDVSPD